MNIFISLFLVPFIVFKLLKKDVCKLDGSNILGVLTDYGCITTINFLISKILASVAFHLLHTEVPIGADEFLIVSIVAAFMTSILYQLDFSIVVKKRDK